MSREPMPQCWICKHFEVNTLWKYPRPHCPAFPEGIPDDIFYNRYDHREPYPDDNDIQMELFDADELRQERGPFKHLSLDEADLEIRKIIAVLDCVRPHFEPYDNEI